MYIWSRKYNYNFINFEKNLQNICDNSFRETSTFLEFYAEKWNPFQLSVQ